MGWFISVNPTTDPMRTLLLTTILISLCLTALLAGFQTMDPGSLSGFAKCQSLSEDELSGFYGKHQE